MRDFHNSDRIAIAGLLASVPLQLPIMRLIQNSLLPSSEILHLSEFLTSGLIYRVQGNTDNPVFEFIEGVRDLLRRTVSISETVKALQEVGEYINEHFGEGEGFVALIPNVNGLETLVFNKQTLPFAQLRAEVLESLGGIHRFTARHLHEKIAQYKEIASSQKKSIEENLHNKVLEILPQIPDTYPPIKENKSRPNLKQNNDFPEVLEVLRSVWLRTYCSSRIRILKLSNDIEVEEEDVIQYAAECLTKELQSGKKIEHPLAWAKAFSERYILQRFKRNRLTEATKLDILEYIADSQAKETTSDLFDDYELLHNSIQKLKPTRRQIIEMRFFQKLDWKQIAEILSSQENKEISATTARKRCERAIIELRYYITNFL
jgi:RNA polymerase sigma factor (sigma-70 family)